MKKSEVISHFKTQKKAAEVIGIKQASVSSWPEDLSLAVSQRVVGALVMAGMDVPDAWIGQKPKRGANAH